MSFCHPAQLERVLSLYVARQYDPLEFGGGRVSAARFEVVRQYASPVINGWAFTTVRALSYDQLCQKSYQND